MTLDGGQFRAMRSAGGAWLLQSRRADGWFDLGSFTEDSQHLLDLVVPAQVGMVLRDAFGLSLSADDEDAIAAWLSRRTAAPRRGGST